MVATPLPRTLTRHGIPHESVDPRLAPRLAASALFHRRRRGSKAPPRRCRGREASALKQGVVLFPAHLAHGMSFIAWRQQSVSEL